jgi:RHS repeat-associated protein
VTDAAGTRTFAYNATLQPESETLSGPAGYTLTRAYDAQGRGAGFDLGPDHTIGYDYDAQGRFASVNWSLTGHTGTATYAYVNNSQLLEGVTFDSGLSSLYSYEPNRNLKTSVSNAYGVTLVSQYDYRYNEIGQRTSRVDTGAAFDQPGFVLWQYNERGELINEDRYVGADIHDTSQPKDAWDRAYAYDPIGNREVATTWDETAGAPETFTYTTNNLNQYTQIADGTSQSLTYDADGSLTAWSEAGATTLYTWNGENRLIAVQPQSPTQGDLKVTFAYDYMGRRFQKTVYGYDSGDWVQTKTVSFTYDGWNLAKETTQQGATQTTQHYAWGLDLSQSIHGAGGVGGLLTLATPTSQYNYCFDANGNVGQLVGEDGDIAAAYEYDGYGRLGQHQGALPGVNPFRFSTKYADPDAKLYYYGYRHYNAKMGRWLCLDPAQESGGYNLYAYVQNPISDFDILGLKKYCERERRVALAAEKKYKEAEAAALSALEVYSELTQQLEIGENQREAYFRLRDKSTDISLDSWKRQFAFDKAMEWKAEMPSYVELEDLRSRHAMWEERLKTAAQTLKDMEPTYIHSVAHYNRCVDECPNWYCRWGSAWIGTATSGGAIMSLYAGAASSVTGVGAVAGGTAAAAFTIASITNDYITFHYCGPKLAMAIDVISVKFPSMIWVSLGSSSLELAEGLSSEVPQKDMSCDLSWEEF